MHLAEAIESKHRVRERLVRSLARAGRATAQGPVGADARPSDPAHEGSLIPETLPETVLELNPLGEYLLNCEISDRTFIL